MRRKEAQPRIRKGVAVLEKLDYSQSGKEIFKLFPLFRKVVYSAFDDHPERITKTQQTILITMRYSGTMSMSQLARRINSSNEQATRAVSQLVQRGFVERSQNEHNHRVVNVSLTDKAEEYLDEVEKLSSRIVADLIGDLDAAKAGQLKKALAELSNLFDAD